MSRTPCFSSFFGIGSWPHSGMPGPPSGPALLQHQHRVLVDRQRRVVDARRHVVVVVEHHRRAGVPAAAAARPRRGLITAPSGARLPRSTASAVGVDQGACRAARITSASYTFAPAMFSPSVLPLTVIASSLSRSPSCAQQRPQAAGIVEVLHQVFARGAHVGEHRRPARERVEAVERQLHAGAARHARSGARPRWSSRPAPCTVVIGVVEDVGGEDVARLQILPHHLDDAPPGQLAMRAMARIGARESRPRPAG